jgi:pimeloyl-ACP methyl ester carboxylesterase
MLFQEDLTANFKKINIPTLLIYGTRDTYTPLYMGRGINNLIKNSKLRIIKGANHGLHIHHPEMINNLAQEFYSNN